MEKYKKQMEEKGYRFTPQREAVLDIIAKEKGKHLTAEEVYDIVKKDKPNIGIATVYRTLQMLEEIGAIRKDYLGSEVVRYELSERDGKHAHHHMVCISCGKILEAKEDLMDSIEEMIQKNYGFRVTDHNIKFLGHCWNCQKD